MKRNSLLPVFLSLFIVFHSLHSFGQEKLEGYKGKAIIPEVKMDGMYRILLSPDVIPFVKDDYADVRIIDQEGQAVPYLRSAESRSRVLQVFKSYSILSKEAIENAYTSIIIGNEEKKTISQFQLKVNNADVHKTARLLGSNDLENWYVIRERISLNSLYSTKETSITEAITFPPSKYPYFKLDIADSNSAPLNVIDAGYYDYVIEKGSYQELPIKRIEQTNGNDGNSHIRLVFEGRQFIDLIQFDIEGAEYYYRECALVKYRRKQIKKRESVIEAVKLANLIVASDRKNQFAFESLAADTIWLVISNQDNPPLNVKEVRAYQLKPYMNAYLKSEMQYQLYFANEGAILPQYDLKYFADNLSGDSPILEVSEIAIQKVEAADDPFFNPDNLWIWIVLSVVLLFLFYLSRKMLSEMDKKKEE